MTVASGLKSITVIDNQKYEFVDTFSAIGGSLTFTCVLPFNESWTPDLDFKLWQLERLGIEVLGELELPIDFGFRFILGQGEFDGLVRPCLEEDCPSMIIYNDSKNRCRMRVVTKFPMMTTSIFTRYYPQYDFLEKAGGRPASMVYDLETIDQDSDEDDPDVIWSKELRAEETIPFNETEKPAKEWLDKHYPDWKDPTAYWTS